MAITEESRHRMYQRLEEVMGHDDASILMEHLPPVGWADVATKRDLDHLATTLELRFEAALHREISALKSTMLLTMILSNATLASVVVAAVKLL